MMHASLLNNIKIGLASQFGIYLANLASLPFLARVLEPDGFGRLVYVQSIMAFIIVFVDYGFSWSAIKTVSTLRNEKKIISKYFFSVWAAQWILTIFFGIMIVLISQNTKILQATDRQLFFGYLIVVGYSLFPFWLLHGLEDLRTSTNIQLISKIATLPLLLILIKSPDDVDLAILFYGLCNIFSGLLFILYLKKLNILEWCKPSCAEIILIYKHGWHIFSAKVNISLCSLLIPLFLNNISGPSSLAHYNLADKIKNIITSLSGPISAALFPRMSFLAENNKKELFSLGIKTAMWQIIFLTPICGLTWIIASDVIVLLGGEQFINATKTLNLLVWLPLLTVTSNILGMQVMIPLGMEKLFSKIYLIGLAVNSILAISLIPTYQEVGAAITLILTEIIMIFIMIYKIRFINLKC